MLLENMQKMRYMSSYSLVDYVIACYLIFIILQVNTSNSHYFWCPFFYTFSSFITRLYRSEYEELLRELFIEAKVLNSSAADPCAENFVPAPTSSETKTFVLYIDMTNKQDFSTWLHLAKVSFWVLKNFHLLWYIEFLELIILVSFYFTYLL